jgi:hypothetical protein
MFVAIVVSAGIVCSLLAFSAAYYFTAAQCVGLAAVLVGASFQASRDRYSIFRTHSWSWVRNLFHTFSIYHFAYKLDRACQHLDAPTDAVGVFPDKLGHAHKAALIDQILRAGPDTYQKKPTNVKQIESLIDCVCGLVEEVQSNGATPLVLDIGAGKALYTRAVYEALERKVSAVALDSRREHLKDEFYDPPKEGAGDPGDRPYTRVVADVRYLAAKTIVPLKESKNGGVVAITKHLCGGATDGSLIALCAPPLDKFVGACCLAPCCHQKTKKQQYCNIPFLESQGFCKTHVGMRGGVQDNDFRIFGMLISISRASDLKEWEYKQSRMLDLFGFKRAQQLGRQARRLLEEGRMRYLRDRGFDVTLVRYCDASITGDNLAIVARRRRA